MRKFSVRNRPLQITKPMSVVHLSPNGTFIGTNGETQYASAYSLEDCVSLILFYFSVQQLLLVHLPQQQAERRCCCGEKASRRVSVYLDLCLTFSSLLKRPISWTRRVSPFPNLQFEKFQITIMKFLTPSSVPMALSSTFHWLLKTRRIRWNITSIDQMR